MAFEIQNHSDIAQNLLIPPRSSLYREFSFGTDWDDIILGSFASIVGTNALEEDSGTNETVKFHQIRDNFLFGISDGDIFNDATSLIYFGPGHPSGAATYKTTSYNMIGYSSASSSYYTAIQSLDGSTINEYGSNNTDYTYWMPSYVDVNASTDFARANIYKFSIANKGTSTQTVNSGGYGGSYASYKNSDPTIHKLKEHCVTPSDDGTAHTFTHNDGAVAYDIPKGVFINNPFFNHSIRIFALTVMKIS